MFIVILNGKKKTILQINNKNYSHYFLREYQLLSSFLYVVLFSLVHIEKGGSSIIKMYESYNKSTQELMAILYLCFGKVILFRPKIMNDNFVEKYIICHNFKGVSRNILKHLLKCKEDLDNKSPNYGFNFNIREKDRDNPLYKEYLPPYDEKKDTDYTIKSFIDYNKMNNSNRSNKETKEFVKHIQDYDYKVADTQINFWKKMDKVLEHTKDYSDDKINKLIQDGLKINLPTCIEYCKEYELVINDEYLPKNEQHQQRISSLFPDVKGVDRFKIQYMDQSIYYVTDYHDANFVNKIIERIFKDKKPSSISVLDGSAHIGGNTIPIALFGFKTSAIEIDKNICQLLKFNIELYKLKVNVICGDFTHHLSKLKEDVVFLDPPWGGTGYKKVF